MSTSGLIAAKKRIESSVKKYAIPTEINAIPTDVCKNGSLLLSLLQSRLNWSTSVFPKFKTDTLLQPKRTNNTRKKWPNMEYIGTCCLELGAHVFEHTSFYRATRIESWVSIAKSQGLDVSEVNDDTNEQLQFVDIVFELKEVTNERFIFPKSAIIDSILADDEQYMVLASFAIPIDPTGNEFFDTPKEKILKYGQSSQLPCIKEFIQLNNTLETRNNDETNTILPNKMYEPANIRLTKVNPGMVEALNSYVLDPDQVRESMREKMKLFSKRPFLKLDLTNDPTATAEINDLVKKATTVPDISAGPIQAEKKRNEILNAIKLGKRLRDEKFEAELPKNKYANAKDDISFKCAYCSTKQTAMWRPGPGGHGTLCNSCGIQWKRGEILKGAPVISIQEERRLFTERKEKEKAADALEQEKLEREHKKQQKKLEKQSTFGHESSTTRNHFAAQLLQQRNRQQMNTVNQKPSASTLNNIPNTASLPENPVALPANGKLSTTSTAPVASTSKSSTAFTQPQHIAPKESVFPPAPAPQEQAKMAPLSLYSAAGIPLPTLSIDFTGSMQFIHPNCGVTLLDGHFSVRLCKDGGEQTTIAIDKKDLIDAEFEVISEGDVPLLREILRMKIMPEKISVQAFGKIMQIDKQNPIQIRFLEKLDPSGGAVVKRILQRWLVTVPHSS